MPTVMVCTDEFSLLGRNEAESLGIPYLPIAVVSHPLGGQKPEQILEKADKSLDQVVSIATTAVPDLMERYRGKV